jgi:hypothetical protein
MIASVRARYTKPHHRSASVLLSTKLRNAVKRDVEALEESI